LFKEENAIVVVVDVLRATSAICTAIHHGVDKMIPVAGLDEARKYKAEGYLVAAERNAIKQDGFDFGNSPYHYIDEDLSGKTIVISTTNGTQAIEAAKDSSTILIGSFLNISSIANWILQQERNVIVLCAGWKNKFNLEDSIFAGALSLKLIQSGKFNTVCDSTIAAGYLYERANNDLYGFLEYSSHRNRLKDLQLENDIRYCLTEDQMETIPVYLDGALVHMSKFEVVNP
jgi:2-phosphosulfolactate phosphatase